MQMQACSSLTRQNPVESFGGNHQRWAWWVGHPSGDSSAGATCGRLRGSRWKVAVAPSYTRTTLPN